MSLAREALVEFGAVYRFEELDAACLKILEAAKRDLGRLSRAGLTPAELETLQLQRDRAADAYAAFLGEGRREAVPQEARESWGALGWRREEPAPAKPYAAEAAPAGEPPAAASSAEEPARAEEMVTLVAPRTPEEEIELSGADRLNYEKGILVGLLRRLCRVAKNELGQDAQDYSLPPAREDLSSITVH
jgi:hypothetical protein